MNRHLSRAVAGIISLSSATNVISAQAPPPKGIPVEDLGTKYELLGRTHQPLGKLIRLQGVVIRATSKGDSGGPNLLVQRIDGQATQEYIRIPLDPFFRAFGKEGGPPTPEVGKTCELLGYETGGFVGSPDEAYGKFNGDFQSSGFYFSTRLIVGELKTIKAIHFAPGEFVGRDALIEGRAVTTDGKAFLNGDGWRLLVQPKAWPAELEGKTAEAFGVIRRGSAANTFAVENARTELVRLEDQVDRKVELRGTAWNTNGGWRFSYRGQEINVEGMKDLPGWNAENHGRPMIIRGTLHHAQQPAPWQEGPKDQYVVTGASWEPIPRLLSPEDVE